MAVSTPSLPEVIADGRWLAHRYDETNDAVQFRFLPKEVHRKITFLTDHEIGDAALAVFSRTDCLMAVRGPILKTPRFIFHSAYCCSTLLARAFDVPGVSFGLKEPQILNDVVGLQLRRADPRKVAAAMDIALMLLARPIEEGEVNVIKPSNLLNPLIPLIIAMRPDIRALLLHAPLDVFLTSIARKEIEGRAWVRELMWKLISLGQAQRFGFSDEDLYRHTDLQVGAVGWLAQQVLFAETAAAQANVRTLESETLLGSAREVMGALGRLFQFSLDANAIASSAAFRTHSKDRAEYTADDREKDRSRGKQLHSREISIVLKWAEQLAEHANVPPILPNSLC